MAMIMVIMVMTKIIMRCGFDNDNSTLLMIVMHSLGVNLVRGGALFPPLHYVTRLPAAPQEEAEINPHSGARRGRQSSCRRACC